MCGGGNYHIRRCGHFVERDIGGRREIDDYAPRAID
jgi:hypothetical protein